MSFDRNARIAWLKETARRRILLLDGSWGVMIQGYPLNEAAFRGSRFGNHGQDLKGNNDLLTLTQPDIIREIGRAYLEAGADIIETNTFNSSSISQADYGLEHLVEELNEEGARLARTICDEAETTDRPRLVAGVLGPTNRTASLSPDVNDPGFRNIAFDALRETYREATRGLIKGGADLIMIETVFDTLNAKAAIFAVEEAFDETGVRLPIWISGTITDLSGRMLTGQTAEALWHSVRHAKPFAIGLNCALGAKELRPYVDELSQVADTLVSAHPNAGLPNEFGGYDDGPDSMAETIGEFARSGLVNIVGGCCGTTPEHIKAFVKAIAGRAAARRSGEAEISAAVGPRAVHAHAGDEFRQYRRAHQHHGLRQVPQADRRQRLRSGARRGAHAGRERRADHRHQHGRGPDRFRSGDAPLPLSHRGRARHRARAGDDRLAPNGA